MAKPRKNSILGVPYEIPAVPETLDELIELAGGGDEGQKHVLEHTLQKLIFNHHNGPLRTAFIQAVEEQTGIERATEKKSREVKGVTKEYTVFTESESEYFERVLAETESKPEAFSDLLQSIASREVEEIKDGDKVIETILAPYYLDPKRVPRQAGDKKLAKTYVQAAEKIAAGSKGLAYAATQLGAELGNTYEATVEGVAQALKDRADRAREQQVAGLV